MTDDKMLIWYTEKDTGVAHCWAADEYNLCGRCGNPDAPNHYCHPDRIRKPRITDPRCPKCEAALREALND